MEAEGVHQMRTDIYHADVHLRSNGTTKDRTKPNM